MENRGTITNQLLLNKLLLNSYKRVEIFFNITSMYFFPLVRNSVPVQIRLGLPMFQNRISSTIFGRIHYSVAPPWGGMCADLFYNLSIETVP